MIRLRTLMFAACVSIGASFAVSAEEAPSQQDGPSLGGRLMEEGARLFFKGLQQEMGPALDSMQGFMEEVGPGMQAFLQEMGPKLGTVLSQVKDWSQYHAPEMLPNGDILMRKKTPSDGTDVPLEDSQNDGLQIEL